VAHCKIKRKRVAFYHLVPCTGIVPSVYFIDENIDLKDLHIKIKKLV